MLNSNWAEWVGYLASILILISLLMSSIAKLRWINLVGSILFSLYGFLIGALPVGFVNLCIAIINVYHLAKIYKTKEYFRILSINPDSEYLQYFLCFYQEDIEKYFSPSTLKIDKNSVGFYVLRNLVPAGIFFGEKYGEDALMVQLDFVIPEYRDFKIGKYIYEDQKDYFLNLGYRRFYSHPLNEKHKNYLLKMGFKEIIENNHKLFAKTISSDKN
ncbi:YgjV family protein [Clostridium formicaceticum]|uniref:N-acetyltransferase domain-containing protein n=1 Tax=Clostridium formicaceticum TaxID=1497 RepID=A0AAC9RSJ6_9CLOT|nr:YgjV family protein [Clostridium formicaceticum]AOY74896.1 hypothetical protein BJL90_02335 [Clostridium formicaceticum]ARE89300.1 hypothetical protein CLFO_37070 [Clostridium formicaceticum]